MIDQIDDQTFYIVIKLIFLVHVCFCVCGSNTDNTFLNRLQPLLCYIIDEECLTVWFLETQDERSLEKLYKILHQ